MVETETMTEIEAYKYIEDLPKGAEKLAASDLHELSTAWQERKEELANSDALKHFNERLIREWAIEAGTLEKLYEIDRGITLTLIEQGLDASLIPFNKTNKPVELVARILNDHKEALEGVFSFVKQQRNLSVSYIKELHQALLKSQKTTEALDPFGNLMDVKLIKGDWKQQPNNPQRQDGTIHAYCPPLHVQDAMDKLIKLHDQHVKDGISPEVEAAWFHHRFTQIHPFQDGNGRVARALASLVFLRAGWFPLVFLGDKRVNYLDALEEADRGNLEPLIVLFGHVQRKAFQRALSLSEDVLSDHVEEHIQQIINAAGKVLQERRDADVKNRHQISKLLEDTAHDFFEIRVAPALQKELQSKERNYRVAAGRSAEATADWYHKQIIEVVREDEKTILKRFKVWLNQVVVAGLDQWRRQL